MKKIVLLSFATILFVSCGENTKKEQNGKDGQPPIKTVSQEVEIHKPGEMTATFKDSSIAEVYKNYNAVKSALVNSDAEKTQTAAKKMVKSLETVEYSDAMKEAAKKIASVPDLETQREVFQYLTEEMTKLVEGNLTSGELYYQFCPMAFDGKGGFWLANSKDIRNPYYGDAMLKCGEVRKVIQ